MTPVKRFLICHYMRSFHGVFHIPNRLFTWRYGGLCHELRNFLNFSFSDPKNGRVFHRLFKTPVDVQQSFRPLANALSDVSARFPARYS